MAYEFQRDVGDLPEAASVRLGGVLTDDAGTPIPGTDLTTCQLTVYDTRSGEPVAGFVGLDIKSSVNASGVLSHRVPLAATVTGSTARRVLRTFLVRFTYNGGLDGGWFRWLATVVLDPQVA